MSTRKILCISDHVDPLIYSNQLKERFKDIDLVLSAGDLDLPYYGFIVSTLNKPLLFVFGNHNLKRIGHYRKEYREESLKFMMKNDFLEKTYGSIYVGGKVKRIEGLIIAGLGGSMRYNNGMNQFNEYQMFMNILRLIPQMLFHRIFHGRWLDILLTHAPPRGIHDREDLCHRGFKSFLWVMRRFKPRYMIHGHVHLYDLNDIRKSTYEETKIVNAYEHTIVEIEVPNK
ncbi:MAG: metallophosphoesterase [Spirochaetota bacterium]